MTRRIIIIDDNHPTLTDLQEACHEEFPDWDVSALRVIGTTQGEVDPGLPEDRYTLIRTLEEAAAAVRRLAGPAQAPLIVFYDLNLEGLQENQRDGLKSVLTAVFRELLAEEGRRMFLAVHSTALASTAFASDAFGQRENVDATFYFTGKPWEHILGSVQKVKSFWTRLFPDQVLLEKQLFHLLATLPPRHFTNPQDPLPATNVGEPAKEREFNDLGEALQWYLRMPKWEFDRHFRDEHGRLVEGACAALKYIGGTGHEINPNEDRPLDLSGAWLLALGVFREVLPLVDWSKIFKPPQIRKEEGSKLELHAHQSTNRKHKTLAAFCNMCRQVFPDRNNDTLPQLKSVDLAPASSLEMVLGFESLPRDRKFDATICGRILNELYGALGEPDYNDDKHSSSNAIWKFVLCCSVSDLPRKFKSAGLFGSYVRMNLKPTNQMETLLVWKK